VTSTTNERQIASRAAQSKRDRVTDKIVITSLMSQPDGRRWVWLRLTEAQIFQQSEDLDHAQLCMKVGLRNAGLRLLRDVTSFTPNEYILMTNEAMAVEATLTKKDANYVGSPDPDSDY
jgi:hypothetical protein